MSCAFVLVGTGLPTLFKGGIPEPGPPGTGDMVLDNEGDTNSKVKTNDDLRNERAAKLLPYIKQFYEQRPGHFPEPHEFDPKLEKDDWLGLAKLLATFINAETCQGITIYVLRLLTELEEKAADERYKRKDIKTVSVQARLARMLTSHAGGVKPPCWSGNHFNRMKLKGVPTTLAALKPVEVKHMTHFLSHTRAHTHACTIPHTRNTHTL